jgi:putative DNA primase/helicase
MGSTADKGILKKLTKNGELSGLLNVALTGLERLRQNQDFTYAASPDEVAELYLKASDPVYAFLTEMCVIKPEHWTSKANLYEAYKSFSLAHKLPTIGKEAFGRALKNSVIASGISPDRRRIQGELTYGWRGVGLADLEEEPEYAEDFDDDDLLF